MDERVVVLGIPESVGEKEATKKGYRIPSEGLALVLKNYFDTCERQASPGGMTVGSKELLPGPLSINGVVLGIHVRPSEDVA